MGQTQRQIYTLIRSALEKAGLVNSGRVLGNRTAPAPMAHRAFRLDPALARNGDGSGRRRGAPGTPLAATLTMTVHLSHDQNPDQPDEGYLDAVDDAELAVNTIVCAEELAAAGVRPTWEQTRIREGSNHVEQDLEFSIAYDHLLPARA